MESGHKFKNLSYKNHSKLGYLDLAFMADKVQKGLDLNLQNIRKKLKFGVSTYVTSRLCHAKNPSKIGYSDLTFAANIGQGTALRQGVPD